jgi:Membrane bound FAD containing D-sorbitol dehydrogenase
MSDTQESTGRRLTRGGFLGASAAAVGGFALAGCGGSSRVRRSSGVLAAVKTRASKADVEGFVRLSQLVTGIEKLPRDHAAMYLNALDEAGLKLPPSRLVEMGGFAEGGGPQTLAEFQQSPLYRKPGARASAEAVAAAWWSGMVPTAKGDKVVTFLDALAWRAQPWAEPFTECLGATGAWAKPGRI